MNDPVERNRIVFKRVVFGNLEEDTDNGLYAEKEMRRYQQISFSQDRVDGDRVFEGFNLHPMWGLYANNGYGVCLVFDKKKLKLEEGDYAGEVQYENYVLPDYAFHNKSKKGIKSEIWRRKDEIFFRKRKEWENEQEYRIIRRSRNEWDNNYLDVSDSLSFVILCKDDSLFEGEPIWAGFHNADIYFIDKKLPVLSYEFGIDGYELWQNGSGYPLWTEFGGFEL